MGFARIMNKSSVGFADSSFTKGAFFKGSRTVTLGRALDLRLLWKRSWLAAGETEDLTRASPRVAVFRRLVDHGANLREVPAHITV